MEDNDVEMNEVPKDQFSEKGPSSGKGYMGALKENPWIIATILLAIIVVVMLVLNFTGMTGNVISEGDAASGLIGYLNTVADGEVTLSGVKDIGNLYEVTVNYNGDEIPVHVTKDGEYFVQGLVPITGNVPSTPSTPTPSDVPKSDKPVVELFVMTHCPYGTQAEKGFIPAIVALGDKIDSSVKFVHYFLHEPEETETPIQVCIREEQGDKFNAYLKEFLKDGDADRAMAAVGINKASLDSCVASKAEGYYAADSALSEGYGVQGSPTLVINGVIAPSGRSADAYLQTICGTFNDAPEECELNLDSANPSAGFGYGTSSGVANAQC
jgi:protein-disulfide isomerase